MKNNCPNCGCWFSDAILSSTDYQIPTAPRIHNKKMLSAIREAVLDHSMNSQLADDVVRCLSPDSVRSMLTERKP